MIVDYGTNSPITYFRVKELYKTNNHRKSLGI